MSRRRSRRNEERRNHILGVVFKILVVGGVLSLTVYYAYEVGYRVAQGEVAALKEQATDVGEALRKSQEEAEGERAALNEARRETEEIKGLYDQVKPTEAMRDLTAILRSRLAEGMDPKRLGLLIKSIPATHDCQVLPPKRFLVRTPHLKGPNTAASVRLDDSLALSADGTGANDGREQWFDPERLLKLHLEGVGGKITEVSGKLPIEHLVNEPGSELHVTVTASTNRGFAEVATEKCELK